MEELLKNNWKISGHAKCFCGCCKRPCFDDLNINMFTIDVVVFLLRGSYKGQAVSDVPNGSIFKSTCYTLYSDIFKNGGKSKTNIIKTIEVLPKEYKKQNDTKTDLAFGNEDVLKYDTTGKTLKWKHWFWGFKLTDPKYRYKNSVTSIIKSMLKCFNILPILSSLLIN